MNENWARWIFASCSAYIDSKKGTSKLYIQGQDRDVGREEDYAELRFTGPSFEQYAKKWYRGKVELNILINVSKNTNDNHKIHRLCGIFEVALGPCIEVKKYGDGVDDDENVAIGYLNRIFNGPKEVITEHFGQIAPDVRALQSTVEAHYEIDLQAQ